MRTIWVGVVLLFQCLPALSQQLVKGTVFGSDTTERIGLVHVINKNTGGLALSNYKGEFQIRAGAGDVLAFVKDGYLSRTISARSQATGTPADSAGNPDGLISVYLSRKPVPPSPPGSELLPQVTVYGKSYLADSLLLRREYERYFPSPPPDLKDAIASDGSLDLNTFISRMMTPWDREFSERLLEYEQKKYINKVFTVERVKQVVDVPEEELEEFMRTCRPSYGFLLKANEYDLVKYIRDAYDLYRRAKYGETLNRRESPGF